jgi:hypothetical protein
MWKVLAPCAVLAGRRVSPTGHGTFDPAAVSIQAGGERKNPERPPRRLIGPQRVKAGMYAGRRLLVERMAVPRNRPDTSSGPGR